MNNGYCDSDKRALLVTRESRREAVLVFYTNLWILFQRLNKSAIVLFTTIIYLNVYYKALKRK